MWNPIPNPNLNLDFGIWNLEFEIRNSFACAEGGARWRATGLENQAEHCVSRVRLLHFPPKSETACGSGWANLPEASPNGMAAVR